MRKPKKISISLMPEISEGKENNLKALA